MPSQAVLVENLPRLLAGNDAVGNWESYFRALLPDTASITDLDALGHRYLTQLGAALRVWLAADVRIDGVSLTGAESARASVESVTDWLIDIRGRFEMEWPLAQMAKSCQENPSACWRIRDRIGSRRATTRYYSSPEEYVPRMFMVHMREDGFPPLETATVESVMAWQAQHRGPVAVERIIDGHWRETEFHQPEDVPAPSPQHQHQLGEQDMTTKPKFQGVQVLAHNDDGTQTVLVQGRLVAGEAKVDRINRNYHNLRVVVADEAGEDKFIFVNAYGDTGPGRVAALRPGSNLVFVARREQQERPNPSTGELETREFFSVVGSIGLNVYVEGSQIRQTKREPAVTPAQEPAPLGVAQ